jgi:hypothetical protein
VLDDNSDAVGMLAGLVEEALVRNLPECFLGEFLLLAEAKKDVFQVSVPKRHGYSSLSMTSPN